MKTRTRPRGRRALPMTGPSSAPTTSHRRSSWRRRRFYAPPWRSPSAAAHRGEECRNPARSRRIRAWSRTGPAQNRQPAACALPPRPAIRTVAPSAIRQLGQSAAGSASATLPPMVPWLRTARYEILPATVRIRPLNRSGILPSSIAAQPGQRADPKGPADVSRQLAFSSPSRSRCRPADPTRATRRRHLSAPAIGTRRQSQPW